MDKRLKQGGKRIDALTQSVNQRFERVEKRFEAMEGWISDIEGRILCFHELLV